MKKRLTAIMLTLVLVLPATTTASDTEADAIHDVWLEWISDPEQTFDPSYNDEHANMAGMLWADAWGACQTYADNVYSIMLIFAMASRMGLRIGTESATLIAGQLEDSEYSCRIAI